MDVIVRGAMLADGRRADLGVDDGLVVALEPELGGVAHREVDGEGLVLLPGTVDAHVHLNDPGRTAWEGIASGTAAFAAGGTTTCADMPLNSVPATVDGAGFDAKAAVVARDARIDVALWGGIVPGNLDRLEELAERGVVGFKAFMSDSGVAEFPAADDETLHAGMCRAAALGLPVAVHAEDPAVLAAAAARLGPAPTLRDVLRARPPEAELAAVERALALAADAGCRLHLVHLSTAAALRLAAAAPHATAELCAHHLLLDEDDAARAGVVAKCAPPLRPRAEVDALWDLLERVDVLASDHSPSPPALRRDDDPAGSWGGIGAGQLLTTALRDGAAARGADLGDRLTAGPARLLGLPGKGRLEPGADADFVLVDPRAAWTVDATTVRHRHPRTAFDGRRVTGRVVQTWLRGREVRPGAPPHGRLVLREQR